MKSDNVVLTKSYAFAIRIVRLSRHIRRESQEYDLARQLLRSGTSIGANVEEAVGAQSRRDFVSKMQIAYKESRETHYWLRILRDTGIVAGPRLDTMLSDCDALLRLTGSISRSARKNGEPASNRHHP
jgi:four helix bundle protein